MKKTLNTGRAKNKLSLDLVLDADPALLGRRGMANQRHDEDRGWQEAVEDFLLFVKGSREEATERFYRDRLRVLTRWACEVAAGGAGVSLQGFKARHMREYLVYRASQTNPATGRPISDSTRRHDAITAKVFLKFCKREEYIDHNPLLDYQVPKAPKPHVHCPTEAEVRALLAASADRWKPQLYPPARFMHAAGRQYFARRNFAILATLVDSAARIGEVLALEITDFSAERCELLIRESKGDRPRTVPISPACVEAIELYLRCRPQAAQSKTLFITEYDGPLAVDRFRNQFYKDLEFAGLTNITLHSLRHYALTTLAKNDVLVAQRIAGHRSLAVTQGYLHVDAVHIRDVHAAAGPLSRILVDTQAEKRRRKKII